MCDCVIFSRQVVMRGGWRRGLIPMILHFHCHTNPQIYSFCSGRCPDFLRDCINFSTLVLAFSVLSKGPKQRSSPANLGHFVVPQICEFYSKQWEKKLSLLEGKCDSVHTHSHSHCYIVNTQSAAWTSFACG